MNIYTVYNTPGLHWITHQFFIEFSLEGTMTELQRIVCKIFVRFDSTTVSACDDCTANCNTYPRCTQFSRGHNQLLWATLWKLQPRLRLRMVVHTQAKFAWNMFCCNFAKFYRQIGCSNRPRNWPRTPSGQVTVQQSQRQLTDCKAADNEILT